MRPVIFDSNNNNYNHITFLEALKATSAAPTYFDNETVLIDGIE